MGIKDAILATIGSSETVHGRTLLQKKLYFLSVLPGERFGFSPHYYGPYSSEVTDQLGALIQAGLVQETPVITGFVSQFGDARRYDYCLTEGGLEVYKQGNKSIDTYVDYLKTIDSDGIANDINLLPVAAKVHHILSGREESTTNEIQEQARNLGWELPEQSVRLVSAYLQHLGLVKNQ